MRLLRLVSVALLLLLPSFASAQQVYDGNQNLPLYGSFAGSDFDIVSLQNGTTRGPVGIDVFFGVGDVAYYLDGVLVIAGFANQLLEHGTAVACPDNLCSGFGTDSRTGDIRYAEFTCFAGGTCGYFNPGDLSHGINEFNGRIYDNENFQKLILEIFWSRIVEQLKKIAETRKISLEEAAKELKIDPGFLKGGNFNFNISKEFHDAGTALCGGNNRCDNGLHYTSVNGNFFVHLDTANPSRDVWSAILHIGDILGGNVLWWVIPRH